MGPFVLYPGLSSTIEHDKALARQGSLTTFFLYSRASVLASLNRKNIASHLKAKSSLYDRAVLFCSRRGHKVTM